VPGCRLLDVLGELDPRSRANVDHRPVRVLGVPDGDQCLAGPDFDAVAVGSAVGGFPPVHLGHITYCDRLITFREQPTAPHVRSVTNSLQSAHAGHRQTRGRGRSGSKLFDRRGGKSVLARPGTVAGRGPSKGGEKEARYGHSGSTWPSRNPFPPVVRCPSYHANTSRSSWSSATPESGHLTARTDPGRSGSTFICRTDRGDPRRSCSPAAPFTVAEVLDRGLLTCVNAPGPRWRR